MRLRDGLVVFIGGAILLGLSPEASAGAPEVIAATATPNGDGSYTISATVRHGDTGWDHYADNFEVMTADGKTMLERRVLYHPHVEEQPFTRSVGGVAVPTGMTHVIIRTHDKVHGYGTKTFKLKLPDR